MKPKRILFSGYARVHFVCFLPVYRRLAKDPRVELWLSGGFRRVDGDTTTYSIEGFYDPFDVDRSRIIPPEQAAQEDFDVVVCAHLSDALFPRSAKRTVQVFHGVSFKNLAVREKALKFDVLCLPGRYHAELYQKKGFVRTGGSECLLTGFAKMDSLVDGSLDRVALLKRIGVDPARPTILFAPTGEKYNALETKGGKIIPRIVEDGAWNLLIKPHDHPKKDINWFEKLAPMENERMKLIRDQDVIPFLHAADLLITDASSVAVEYTLLDRPIVFIDVPKLFKKVEKRAEALDLQTYGRKIGVVVKKSAQVIDAVRDSLDHPDREGEVRRKMASHLFHGPGGATRRVAGVVLHAAGVEESLPEGVERIVPQEARVVDS